MRSLFNPGVQKGADHTVPKGLGAACEGPNRENGEREEDGAAAEGEASPANEPAAGLSVQMKRPGHWCPGRVGPARRLSYSSFFGSV